METTFIYALCEPGTRTVRYIGKANNPAYRFKQHLRESVRAKTHLGNWLRSLLSLGEKPTLVVLREVPDEQREIAEERYIRLARGCGMRLVNGTDGGDGLHNPSAEIREKIAAGNRGKIVSKESREKMRASKLAMREYLSESNSGEKNPMFGRSGETNPMFGQAHTDLARSKMSAAKKGTRPSDAALQAASAATRGVPLTAEHRAKQSAAQKRVWAARKAAKLCKT